MVAAGYTIAASLQRGESFASELRAKTKCITMFFSIRLAEVAGLEEELKEKAVVVAEKVRGERKKAETCNVWPNWVGAPPTGVRVDSHGQDVPKLGSCSRAKTYSDDAELIWRHVALRLEFFQNCHVYIICRP